MNKFKCFINGIWLSIKNFAIISGHDYVETVNTPTIQILVCQRCKKRSIGIKDIK